MAATYVNNLRVAEPADGDSNWGNTTNTSLELIGEALGYGTEAITTNADTHSSEIADGSTDQARAMYLKYTGTLDSACTITIGPNTIKRFQIIENATSGSQSIIISQGSGANVTIANGGVKAVYLDGAGSGAAVLDAFVDLSVGGGFTIGTATDGVIITQGDIAVKNGGGAPSTIKLYCESSNAHYAEIKSPAHSAYSGNVTLTLPVTTSNLVGDSATQTLTNKTINASNNTLSNIPMSATSFSAGTGVTLSTNTLNVDAAQTGITSLLATDIKIGEDDETKIDFEDADKINFYAGNEKQLILEDGALYPGSDNIIDLGKSDNEFKDAFFDGTVTADAFAGPLTGDVTGNVSGTAATVTGAAQSNITSLGTLTTLTVDNVIINGTTIGHTDDTDLLTVADGVLTVAGEVSMTTLDIGGTNVTATAAELNYLDISTLGTTEASKVVTTDANGVPKFEAAITEKAVTATISSTTAALDIRDGSVFELTLGSDIDTFNWSNHAGSGNVSSFIIKVVQDGTGSRTIAWPDNTNSVTVRWAGNTAPTLSTGAADIDVFVFFTLDGGTNYYGFTAGQDML